MPLLADLDDPPRPRWPGFLLGLLVAAPFAAAIAWGLLPYLYDQLTGGAADFDSRLRAEDTYMHTLCTEAIELPRDEDLCSCALAAEFPALDCRPQFSAWALARQHERCAETGLRAEALSFCACIDAVMERAMKAPDPDARRVAEQRYGACNELDDALDLPELDGLAPVPGDGSGSGDPAAAAPG